MGAEPPIEDDPLLRRVAALRPSIPEDDLSPGGQRARAIAERVLAGQPSTAARRAGGRWALRPRWASSWAGLAVAGGLAAIVLLLAGTFRGPDNSGTQPAAAAVVRAAIRALTLSPGSIFVQNETYVSGPSVHGHPYTLNQVQETPTVRGPQNLLTTTDDPRAVGSPPGQSGWAYVGGTEEIYSSVTNTIYVSSIWGPYLHPGRRPGTFVYRYAAGAPTYAQHPVAITASQVRALRRGEATIIRPSPTGPFEVTPPLHAPGYAQTVRDEISHHMLHFVGRTTVDGRPALEFAGTTNGGRSGDAHIDLDPTTHLPFEEVDQPGTARQQVIHLYLRRLPITRANERLLSLRVLHPTARIDRSHQDYLRVAHGVQIFTG